MLTLPATMLCWLQGSLLVQAECVMGHMEQPAAAAHPAAQQGAPASHASNGTGKEGSSHSVPLRRVKAQGAHLAKVHNGVTHAATEAGAFGAAATPAGDAMSGVLAATGSTNGSGSAGRQQGHHGQAATGPSDAQLVFSERCGRVRLVNVRVQNRGIDWEHPGNVYWRHKVGKGGRGGRRVAGLGQHAGVSLWVLEGGKGALMLPPGVCGCMEASARRLHLLTFTFTCIALLWGLR